jgi:hypothetical protein
MDRISNEPAGFQQTQTTRVKSTGPETDANPPPPPRKTESAPSEYPPSPHPFRGQNLNTVA